MVAASTASATEDGHGRAGAVGAPGVRLLDLYLSSVIERAVFERKYHNLTAQQEGLRQQQRQLEAQARQHLDLVKLTDTITAFCHRLQATLDHLDFAQQRQLGELLVDCVIVSDD